MDSLVRDYITELIDNHTTLSTPSIYPSSMIVLQSQNTTTVTHVHYTLTSTYYVESTIRHYNNDVKLSSEFHNEWNKQCSIVQALATNTQTAANYCLQLRQEKWRFSHGSCHLLNRDRKKFKIQLPLTSTNGTKILKNLFLMPIED